MSTHENALAVGADKGAEGIAVNSDKNNSSIALLPDKYQAQQFLNWLDPAAQRFEFRLFKDKEKGKAGIKLSGTLAQRWPELARRNREGYGVFVQINQSAAPLAQSSKDITRVRALFADFDQANESTLPRLLDDPLRPAVIIESSPNKWHAYWLPEDGLPLNEFKPLQQAIAASLGSDPAICDLPRVMRLAGFWHHKGEPFLTRLFYIRHTAPCCMPQKGGEP